MDFDPHGQGKGDETTGGCPCIGRCGGGGFGETVGGSPGGIFHQVIGQATGDVAARTLGVEARVILSDNGLGLLPKLDPQKSGWGDEAAFKGVFKIMTGVGDLIRQVDNLGF